MAAKERVMEGKHGISECAHFLRENPRFFNEPICTVEDNSASNVADCLEWNYATTRVHSVAHSVGQACRKPVTSLNQSVLSHLLLLVHVYIIATFCRSIIVLIILAG